MDENSEASERVPSKIPSREVVLQGDLTIPEGAKGIVLFAHGSGSSRFSPRNRYVAEVLQPSDLATLLMDLLTQEEEAIDRFTRHLRFDIELLSGRVVDAIKWLEEKPDTSDLDLGLFGSSTGAASALIAATRKPDCVEAIVSRGGRPDLARDYLADVEAPTLLIVGGKDKPVIRMNREAMNKLEVTKSLEIVPGASHLFEEPGKLEEVARLATEWFSKHLGG